MLTVSWFGGWSSTDFFGLAIAGKAQVLPIPVNHVSVAVSQQAQH